MERFWPNKLYEGDDKEIYTKGDDTESLFDHAHIDSAAHARIELLTRPRRA